MSSIITQTSQEVNITNKDSSIKETSINENLELSKNSTQLENTNSLTPCQNELENPSLTLLSEEIFPEDNLSMQEIKEFENNFNTYYVDSSKNSNGNFDNYIESGLKLISLFPNETIYKNQVENIKQKITLPPKDPKKKKNLIVDLDETLIHSDFDLNFNNHDIVLKFECEDDEFPEEKSEVPIPLILRPFVKEFLDFASENFELFVFTASYKSYADTILDYLEKDKKYFKFRLYREHCVSIHNCLYVKDLSIFEGQRDLKDIILVDNSIFSFSRQLSNGILVTSFYNDTEDCFLGNLMYYLKKCILPCSDVRKVNDEFFKFTELIKKFQNEIFNEPSV